MRVTRSTMLSLTAALLLAACGDDATGPAGDLSQAEAAALAEVVGFTVFSSVEHAPLPGADASQAPALAPFSGEDHLDGTFPCALGGSVDFVLDVAYDGDDETGEVEASMELSQVHRDCRAESQDGYRFTLNGAPGVDGLVQLAASGSTFAFDGGYAGGVDFEIDDRTGTCQLDVGFSFGTDWEAGTATASITGSVCGINVSRQATYGG